MTTNNKVHLSDHPVLSHKISILRSSSTIPAAFRAVLRELTFHLGYEATSTLSTKSVPVSVPLNGDATDGEHLEFTGARLADKVALVPILRSGLGMVDSMLELIPNAAVHHIGMYRRDLMPVQYYNRLPKKCTADVAYVLDPVIATSNTIMSVIGILKKWGVKKIHVISVVASEEGVNSLSKSHPDVFMTLGNIDKELRKDGTLIPGIGDAGDRLFGTGHVEDEEVLLHPSKRKRSLSNVSDS